MITMQSWMFLSSFEKLREKLLDNATILSMAHLGARGFDSIGGEVVSTTAFVLESGYIPEYLLEQAASSDSSVSKASQGDGAFPEGRGDEAMPQKPLESGSKGAP